MRILLLLLALAILPGNGQAEAPRAWETWDGCRLMTERFYDGDSFQVKHGRSIFVLRLYSADAPETDDGYGTRIGEQAAYFGVTNAEILRGGTAAKEFTAKFLATPFRVITRRKSAPGASRAERYYAIVESNNGQRLDAALIQAGLARATGESADYPDAESAHMRLVQLRGLEQKAASDRRRLWATSQRKDRLPAPTEKLKPFLPGAPIAARKVNLNTATTGDLEALPGIGPKTAEAIIRARPLRDLTALDAVPGIGPKKIAALRDLVSFQ